MKERLCFILIFAGLLPLSVLAQYPSNKPTPAFTISERKGCAPLTFEVTHPGCDGGAACFVRFDDGRPDLAFVDGDEITYPDPGNFTFRIIGQTIPDSDEIEIQVFPATQPTFEVYSCETGGIQVVITDTQFPEYNIDFKDGPEIFVPMGNTPHNHTYTAPLPPLENIEVRGIHHDTPPPSNPSDNRASDNCPVTTIPVTIYPNALNPAPIEELRVLDDGITIELDFPSADPSVQYKLMKAPDNTATGFTPFKTLYGVSSDVITTLQPDKDFFCFRLDTFNPCGGNATSSNIICSINFDVTPQNNQIDFTAASSATGSPTLSVERNGIPISPVSPDAMVTCNTDYTYRATATYPDASRSISMNKTARSFSTDVPPSVENISSAAGESSVHLQWQLPLGVTAVSYIINESSGGQTHPLETSLVPEYTDNSYAYPTEYSVIYTNTCGNRSKPGTIARPMQLTGTLLKDNTVILQWSEHKGWKDPVHHYELYADGVLIVPLILPPTPPDELSLSIPDDLTTQKHIYEIRAVADPAAVPLIPASLSNELVVIKKPNLSSPAAFTPNNDKMNDTFMVYALYAASIEFKIFNRWGEMMFMTDDLDSDGWDGEYRGNPMPEGTYVFTARITDFEGRTFDHSGTVVLLRKEEQ